MRSRVETIPADARTVLIAANPRSGARSSRALVDQLAAALASHGLEARVISNLDELALAALEARQAGRLRAVVAAGGDGTLAELVNRTAPDTPLSVFPLGTANLMANYLGLEPRAEPFAAMLAAGKAIRLDAARAQTASDPPAGNDVPPASPGRVFLIVAGVGFDAAVVKRLHQGRSGHIRMWNYAKPIWDCLRTYSYPRLRCRCACVALDDRPGRNEDGPAGRYEVEFEASWLFVQNVPCYAGGLQSAPGATAADGLLDVCALEHGSFRHGLRYLVHVLAGRHEGLPDCRAMRVEKISIAADTQTLVQLDGDPGGQLPLEIESLPARVRLVVPQAAIAKLTAPGHGKPLTGQNKPRRNQAERSSARPATHS